MQSAPLAEAIAILMHKASFILRVFGVKAKLVALMQAEEPLARQELDEVPLSDPEFKRCYRVDKETFNYLLDLIEARLAKGTRGRGDRLEADIMLSRTLT